MHVPLDERDKAWKSRVVNSKRRMEEEVRKVAGRRVGDGEGLKSDIKEPICQKCKFSPQQRPSRVLLTSKNKYTHDLGNLAKTCLKMNVKRNQLNISTHCLRH